VLRKKNNRLDDEASGNVSEVSFQMACERGEGDPGAASSGEEEERV